MHKFKIHTPDGTADILPAECGAKAKIEQTVGDIFASYGYNGIQTPMFEYYDVFKDEWGAVKQETMLKFIGDGGQILALRPDITTSIARVATTKYSEDKYPLRFCYIGSAFRNAESFQGALQKEFTQAGIELIGEGSAEADAEVIAVTINAIKAAGLTDFEVELGQVAFFKSLMHEAGLDGECAESVRQYIDRKDFWGLQELLETKGVKGELKEIISNLPSLFGGFEVLEKAKNFGLGKQSGQALKNLDDIYNILKEYGLENYISIDLGMVSNIDYYTGVIFRVLARGMGFAIGGGGRYDGLAKRFGNSTPSTGAAIGVDRLLSALYRNGAVFENPKPDCVVGYAPKFRSTALQIANSLRSQGLVVEQFYGKKGIAEFAQNKGTGGYMVVIDANTVEITDMENNTVKTVNITELIQTGGGK